MIELPEEKYYLAERNIRDVKINNLFARFVIEKHVSGKIYVDNIENPGTFYVVHPYDMSLLFGNHSNTDFNDQFRTYALNLNNNRDRFMWLQTYPRDWDNVLKELFGDRMIDSLENKDKTEKGIIELHSRVNFVFNREKYLRKKKLSLQKEDQIVDTGSLYFEQMHGSVIPYKFWNSGRDFEQHGKGFTLLHRGEIASTAYSAFVLDDSLEIGIETVEKFRGAGFAEMTCSSLIDYCLEKKLTPVWSCRLNNLASFKLAQKLGFEPSLLLPFYRLSK